ncbi:hypothetical protein LOCC1_G001649 [Lachnellula occidentalis]|uniref:Ubiquitin-like domain-containing protein n=1 Tax=Lachnellula occidentalis TaxID=215460 RepID=A0A8H8UKD6_9HELO|nr:hypothetical protein LOCC1_G001649 [Lachnellula occidentalis]
MSFGFSGGNFLGLGRLIADITSSLREAGGSKSEYQELLQELESLNHALKHLDKKIEKYDKALGIWGGANRIKQTADKLQWAFGEKGEIKKLQNHLSIHIGTINILLAEHGLEMMNLASNKRELDQLHIRKRLEVTKSLVQMMKDDVTAQTAAVQNNSSMLTKLFGMVSGELGSSLKGLGEMVAKVCVSTQQIYGIVLEIRASQATPDAKWTFFQAPLMVEDALGFRFPVPSEYDFGLLNAIIRHRFLEGPGSEEVQADHYEIFSAKNSQVDISDNVRLLPGASIIMAILLDKPAGKAYTDETCPMRRCVSTLTTAAPGGGRTCVRCGVWFDHSKKKRKIDVLLFDIDPEDEGFSEDRSPSENLEVRSKRVSKSLESRDCFKNVKLAEQISLQYLYPFSRPAFDRYTVGKYFKTFQDKPQVYKQSIEMLQNHQRESGALKFA